jgi:hypothetical protein
MKYKKILGLVSVLAICSGQASAQTGQDKINALIASLSSIQDRIDNGSVLTVGAVGYADIGGVIVDNAFNDAIITEQELTNYLISKQAVLEHDYAVAQTAEQMFMQEFSGAMHNLGLAIDSLTAATTDIIMATSVMEAAAVADTSPEQTALQDMLQTEEYSIQAEEVSAYNDALVAVENYSQQAGAFMAAANDGGLTASIDQYAAAGGFVIGNYTAITYTQSIDEFVIAWANDGFTSGWQGYLTTEMKGVSDIYAAGDYINMYGALPTQ